MKDLASLVMESLEKKKKEYKFIFLDEKKNELKLVRSKFHLRSANGKSLGFYIEYYDGALWGEDIKESKTKHWRYIGKI